MRNQYPSDISREQFNKIEPLLDSFRKKTKPIKVDLYEIFCAILYLLKSGCQWRMIPKDFPNWRTVYGYFRIWKKTECETEASLLESILSKLVEEHRVSENREEKTSFVIIDSQSVQNADTAKEKGYDAAKSVSGIKRHLAVDTQGLPHAIHITTANVTDRNGAIEAFQKSSEALSSVVNVLADSAYSGEAFAEAVQQEIGASVEIAKRSELHTFKVIPKRWVVERSFGWLDKCRRLWKNCERDINTSLQMVVLAFITILLKRT